MSPAHALPQNTLLCASYASCFLTSIILTDYLLLSILSHTLLVLLLFLVTCSRLLCCRGKANGEVFEDTTARGKVGYAFSVFISFFMRREPLALLILPAVCVSVLGSTFLCLCHCHGNPVYFFLSLILQNQSAVVG